MTKNTKTVIILLVIAALIAIVPLFALKKITASETNRLLHAIHISRLIIENRTLKPAFQLLICDAYA